MLLIQQATAQDRPMLTLNETLTILAILAAPIVAIQVQKWLERRRETREQKLRVFRTLMATRATKLSPAYVEALNMIDLTFTAKKEKAVRDRWKECLDKFANAPKVPDTQNVDAADPAKASKVQAEYARYEAELKSWGVDLDDRLADLMHEMGKSLGYEYDKVHIKRGVYIPKEHTDIELDQRAIRQGLVQLLWFRRPLPLEVTSVPGTDETESHQQEELRKLLIANLKGERSIPVKVVKEDGKPLP